MPEIIAPSSIRTRYVGTALNAATRAWLEQELTAFEGRHGLLARRPALLRVAAVFLKHCCPPTPEYDALGAVARVLSLVLYFNDRVAPERLAIEAAATWALLFGPSAELPLLTRGGGAEDGISAPLVAAARETRGALRDAAGRRGADLTSFAHLFRVNLAAFTWVTERHAVPRAVEEHLELRVETISAIAYLRLWGLLGGLRPATECRFGLHLQRIERLSALVQALANDLRSVQRDGQEGQPNAVLLEASGATDAEAWARVTQRHTDTLAALDDALQLARRTAAGSAPDLEDYLRFVEICTRGNDEAMDELASRYG